ncbi:hypothetical protein C0Q70_15243 [Pomacea canaliculata]|uniref:Peptidase S1 domain-containing protein n=1 Tax=Pomacea canaliculata TaxID=400727 RepID=A0A2T7NUA3_POMCA|nr:hypothetical protein C0Q70_15243 [Pomacea canaliculata]
MSSSHRSEHVLASLCLSSPQSYKVRSRVRQSKDPEAGVQLRHLLPAKRVRGDWLARMLVACHVISMCRACTPQSPCTSCSVLATVADHADCTRYFTCSFGRIYAPQRCSKGIYSPVYGMCVEGDAATCRRDDPPSVISQPSPQTLAPDHGKGLTTRKTKEGRNSVTKCLSASGLCGVRTSRYIVGGSGTEPGDWPWQVSLRFYDPGSAKSWHFCGATLVSSRWAMTAAHCVLRHAPSSLQIVAGASDLHTTVPGEIHMQVKTIKVHPGYVDYGNFPNDIALIELADDIAFDGSNLARPACLPQQNEKMVEETPASPLENDSKGCWVTGWGSTLGTGAQFRLKKIKQNIVDPKDCRSQWASYIQPYHVCVGDGSSGACRGDSGGPLVCSKKGRFFLVGVVSWGEDTCRLKGYPNIATGVSSYRDWIDFVVAST